VTEVWNKSKCERIARRLGKDYFGTTFPFPGYLYMLAHMVEFYGTKLPTVAKEFKIIYVPTWGYRLVKI